MSPELNFAERLAAQVQWFAPVWTVLKATTPLEYAANISYLISVWLAGRNSVHTWWTGIVGVLLFAVLFYQGQLYADVTLQVFYLGTSIYGWYLWQSGKNRQELPITRVVPLHLLGYAALALLVTLGYGWLLHRFTDAYAPYWDSVVLTCSVVAQLLLMGRKLENWIFWIIVDLVAIPLYSSREYYFTAGVYVLFLINAVWALTNWIRLYRHEQKTV